MSTGFLNFTVIPGQSQRLRSLPSVGTFSEKNCVSIDNFGLYVTKFSDYQQYKQLYDHTLVSVIQKIKSDMERGHCTPQYNENEIKIINGIKGIILSELQTDEDGNVYSDGRLKTICPNLRKIIGGGKTRRLTTKQKRYSRKSKKITKHVRYHKRK